MTGLRLRHAVKLRVERCDDSRPLLNLDQIESGTGRLLGDIGVAQSEGAIRFEPGDVLFSKLRPYLAKSLLVHAPLQGTGELLAMVSGTRVDPRFLFYVTLSQPWLELAAITSYGTKMPRTSWDAMSDYPLPDLPLASQRRIAEFLDDQVARIDKMISARQRQVELESERFRAAQDDCVLGRLEAANTVIADWAPFGVVPAAWIQTRLRSMPCTIQTGPFGSQLHSDEYVEDGWPVVNPAGLTESRIVRVPGMSVPDSVRVRLERHWLRDGDVIFGRRGELGRSALVTAAEQGWILGTGSLMVRLDTDAPLMPGYLVRLLESTALRFYFDSVAVGSTMANLNVSILAAMPMLLPGRDFQGASIAAVNEMESAHRDSLKALTSGVELLDELKRSLITSAVTGEFDVSSADGSRVLA